MNNERNKKRTMKNDVHLSSFIIHFYVHRSDFFSK